MACGTGDNASIGSQSTQECEHRVPLTAVSLPALLLTPAFTMVAANDALIQVSGTKREDIVGRNIFDVFPDNPNDPGAGGVQNLKASLERVLRDKVSDTMAVQKYDIPIRGSEPVEFEVRYWSPTNTPILNESGELTHILHQVTDVTSAIISKHKQDLLGFEIFRRTEEVRAANLELKLAKEHLERMVIERTAQLAESEARLLQATAAAQIGLWEIDPTTGQAWRSPSHDRLFGYEEPLPSWTFQDFLEHVRSEGRDRVASEFSFANDYWNTEFRIVRKDGSIRWMAAKGEVQRNASGDILRVSGVNFDITEGKEAEIQMTLDKQKFEAVFLESPAAMALLKGSDLVFEKVNPRYRRMMGDRELTGLQFTEAIPELRDQLFPELLRTVYETGEPFIGTEVQARVLRSQGGKPEESYWDIACIRILDAQGNPYGVYNHAYDVTDKVLFRMRLEEAKTELLQAKEAAESASRMKSAFLANMSHEIRTPLGAIIGFTELLKDSSLHKVEREQFLDTISRSGRALTRLIDDILDLAKVEAGRLDIETIDFSISELMSDVVELFREKARQKNVSLLLKIEEGQPDRICSDPSRLRQILINIVGNAIKFTNEGGVRVEVRSEPSGGGMHQVTIDVIDSGIGLSNEQRDQLFQPFAQADNTTTRRYGGTGLGLALSRRLSEALGGNITINNCTPKAGCTFTLIFKATEAKTNPLSPARDDSSLRPKSHRKRELLLREVRVLAVDDSPENLLLVTRLLSKNGAVVDTAENGEEAVAKAFANSYDVVLMDIQMPKMDGYQAKKMLDQTGYKSPVVALTAHAMKEERFKTQEAGFSAHLTKPLNNNQLVETIARIVTESRAGRHPDLEV